MLRGALASSEVHHDAADPAGGIAGVEGARSANVRQDTKVPNWGRAPSIQHVGGLQLMKARLEPFRAHSADHGEIAAARGDVQDPTRLK